MDFTTTKENKVYILGAGGFAREVLDIFASGGIEKWVLGFLEDDCNRVGTLLNGKRVKDMSLLNKKNTSTNF